MGLTKEQQAIWQAMDVGPEWVLRTSGASLSSLEASSEIPDGKNEDEGSFSGKTPSSVKSNQVETKPVIHEAPVTFVDNTALQEAARVAPWEKIAALINECKACEMASSRLNTVFADGAPGCPIAIVGEAPGRDEDLQGVPFVGKSGQLLTNLLTSHGLKRGSDVVIINVLKCRPPLNRDPKPEEMTRCAAFLDRQLELIAPKVLILMGRAAVTRLLGETVAISRLRGKTHYVTIAGREVPTVVTYHPSYLLRSPLEKEKGWVDIYRAKSLLKEKGDAAD